MQTKIRIRAGSLEIEYEGPDTYLYKQLPELIAQLQDILPRSEIPELIPRRAPSGSDAIIAPEKANGNGTAAAGGNGGVHAHPPIPEDLTGENAPRLEELIGALGPSAAQWKRFLATTVWLHTLGLTRVRTKEVTNALQKHEARSIGNPNACLMRNLDKGYLTRDGAAFYVTKDGIEALEGAFTI
jgi:hypothetical protein